MAVLCATTFACANSFPSYYQHIVQTGNLNTNLANDQGVGNVVQNSNGNANTNHYLNSVNGVYSAIINDNTFAGNQEVSLIDDTSNYGVNQVSNNNNDADNVENHVLLNGPVNSIHTFNVRNTLARTKSTHGNATIQQVRNGNNASNVFNNTA